MSNALINIPIEELSDGYWSLCNTAFDRSVSSASAMTESKRGNCFSLSAYLCRKLVDSAPVAVAGIGIEVLPSRRNYHAFAWALMPAALGLVRLDLLSEYPERVDTAPRLQYELKLLDSGSADVVYRSTGSETDGEDVKRLAVDQRHQWPSGSDRHEQVFLGVETGIVALEVIARQGGTRRLLPTLADPEVPTMPRR